jgi:uncharacterized surface anchored protein
LNLRRFIPKSRRARIGTLAAIIAVAVAVPVIATTLAPSKFEIDIDNSSTDHPLQANLTVDTSGNIDWCTDFPAPTSGGCTTKAPSFAKQDDLTKSNADDALGQGTKEDSPVPSVVTGSIPPQKSDFTEFYTANEKIGDDVFLYLGWERSNTLGTANMDFELNQSDTKSSNGVTPVRTAGDLLFTYDFAKGGKVVSVHLLSWVTSGAASQCAANNAVPCWAGPKNADGSVGFDLNTSGVAVGSANDGNTPYDPIIQKTLADGTFGEVSINLTDALDLVGGSGSCESFAGAYLKSRSSTSFTSEIKDLVKPIGLSINLCKPDTITLEKRDAHGNLLAGATLELWRETNGVTGLQTTANGGTPADTKVGSCTSNQSGCTFTNITIAGVYYGHEATAPNGYNKGPDPAAQTIVIDGTGHSYTFTFTDSPAPGQIDVQKRDDSATPVGLANVTFRLYKDVGTVGTFEDGVDNVAANLVDTQTTDANGNLSFLSVPQGDYCVVEGTPPTGYSAAAPQCGVHVGLGSQPGQGPATITLTFTNPRLHKIIVITCHEGSNTLVQSTVKLNPGTADEVSKTSLGSAPAGMTAAQLCGLGGASFGGLDHGTKPLSVAIPGSGSGSGH